MLLRSIVSRIHRNQRPANLCSFKNSNSSLSTPKSGPSIQKPPEKEYVISYLVSSCGLSPENAITASKKLHFDSPDKPNSVLNFLQKKGFTKTQIADLVKGRPQFLLSNPEKSLLPKIRFFSRFTGVSQNDVEVRRIASDLLVNPVQVNIGNVDELVANKSITQDEKNKRFLKDEREKEEEAKGREVHVIHDLPLGFTISPDHRPN
ncbi:dead-box ATP-dependent RNA helicase 46 [Phtheirospermum japonicum]|uniref:Dead-box ATP-dependent RNA helicase 46 n=1 Tax=Phtheirospermum japonicum TaxID=374723 RepID=A0A830D987_9LAMI|nr:dead-box ATP-dependent RNA helicase 46 [Phtheirospermum japonicum]